MTDAPLPATVNFDGLSSVQDLGRAVASLRRQAKLSQTALGQMAGLSRMPVYRLEAGRDISLSSLMAILLALRQQVALQPVPGRALRPQDLRAAFAHLHADADEEAG